MVTFAQPMAAHSKLIDLKTAFFWQIHRANLSARRGCLPCNEQEKLQAIQQACGARLTQQGTENVCLGVNYSKCAPTRHFVVVSCSICLSTFSYTSAILGFQAIC